MSNAVALDIGLTGDGNISLRIHDVGLPAETEIIMSADEARAFMVALAEAIGMAEAVPEGRAISMAEGRA